MSKISVKEASKKRVAKQAKTKTSQTKTKPNAEKAVEFLEEELSQRSYLNSTEARKAAANAMRDHCPRKDLGGWHTPSHRRDPVEIIIESSKGRLKQLVPLRYGRMVVSPFTFYRGAAAIMANDLAATARTGLNLQICGDCHLLNFGGFATPERKLVFDINDFDETSVAPWEWDVKRLTASMVIAAHDRGFSSTQAMEAAWYAASAYREHMQIYAETPVLETWYEQIDLEEIIDDMADQEMKKSVKKQVQKATSYTVHTKEFVKLTVGEGSPAYIKDEPPLIFHDESLSAFTDSGERDMAFVIYRNSLSLERRLLLDRFKVVDSAIKVVGVGSVGTYCAIILLISGNGDPLFLQIKEARQSVLAPFAGATPYEHQGQRVVLGQKIMQAASDVFLGWTSGPDRQFYLRQLRDAKISPQIEIMKSDNLRRYGQLCGRALARAHARSGDAFLLANYLGKSDAFADAMASFAVAYAGQNERDYSAMLKAVRAGKIEVETLS